MEVYLCGIGTGIAIGGFKACDDTIGAHCRAEDDYFKRFDASRPSVIAVLAEVPREVGAFIVAYRQFIRGIEKKEV